MDINQTNTQPQNPTPTPTFPNQQPSSPMMSSPKKTPVGPIIGLLIILAIIVIGTLYFWGQRVDTKNQAVQQAPTTEETSQPQTDSQTEQLQQQSTSDEIDSIESDLNSTDFNNIDSSSELLP